MNDRLPVTGDAPEHAERNLWLWSAFARSVRDNMVAEFVVQALRNTEAEFREAALSAMAARSRRLVESELAAPTTLRAAEVAKARREVVKIVLAMAQKGELELPSGQPQDGAAAA